MNSGRQITNEQGTTIANEQQEQAEQVLQEAMNMKQVRAQRTQASSSLREGQPESLQLGLDGGWLPERVQKGGMEGKIGVVASRVEAVGKRGRHRLSQRRYVATFGPTEELGILTYAAADELGATEAKQQVVLGDGARWIKTQAGFRIFLTRSRSQDSAPSVAPASVMPCVRFSQAKLLLAGHGAREQYEVLLPRFGGR
jgi:hypothetical protein